MAKCDACGGKGAMRYDTGGYEMCERCQGCGFEPEADTPVVVGVDPADPATPGGWTVQVVGTRYTPPADAQKVADFGRRYAYRYDARAYIRDAARAYIRDAARAYIRDAAERWWEEEVRPKAPQAERRLAVLWVNESTVLDVCVREGLSNPGVVVRGELPGLPADVKVHEVRHEWSRKQFGFVLSSASFPPVPDYEQIPDVPGRLLMRYNYVEIGTRPAAYYPDAAKKEMPSAFRDKPVGWAVSSAEGHLATFAHEHLADEYLKFIRGPGR